MFKSKYDKEHEKDKGNDKAITHEEAGQ